ncbi:MAG: hypothetical protein V1916_00945, partial [Patescibacteria group bacterium]
MQPNWCAFRYGQIDSEGSFGKARMQQPVVCAVGPGAVESGFHHIRYHGQPANMVPDACLVSPVSAETIR